MRQRNRDATLLYRTTLEAIANAEAVPLANQPRAGALEAAPGGVGATEVERRQLSEDQIIEIVRREAEERRLAAGVPGIAEATRAKLTRDADHLEALLQR